MIGVQHKGECCPFFFGGGGGQTSQIYNKKGKGCPRFNHLFLTRSLSEKAADVFLRFFPSNIGLNQPNVSNQFFMFGVLKIGGNAALFFG